VETEKKTRKDRTMKKPEIIQDFNKFMRGADRADQILHYSPCCRKTMEWTKKFVFFMLHMAALNIFILLKKYTTNQKQKDKVMLSRTSYLTVEEGEDDRDSMG
jgi:hypothetical protein